MGTLEGRYRVRLFFELQGDEADFAVGYQKHLEPVVGRHGLVEGRADPEAAPGYFCRLFDVDEEVRPSEIQANLADDADWLAALAPLAPLGGTVQLYGRAVFLELYSRQAKPAVVHKIGAGVRQGRWLGFDHGDGLLTSAVRALCEDGEGRLWLGGLRGLSCFDGAYSYHYDMRTMPASCTPHDAFVVINDVIAAADGCIWFTLGGHNGVGCLRGDQLRLYSAADGLGVCQLNRLLEDRQGRLWVGSNDGLWQFNGRHFERAGLAGEAVEHMLEDPEGIMWLAVPDAVVCWDRGRTRRFPIPSGRSYWNPLALDDIGSVLAAGRRGVWRFDGSGFVPLEGVGEEEVLGLLVDRGGALWIGGNSGLLRRSAGRVQRWTVRDGLVHNQVLCLLANRDGDLWVGTGSGICRYDESHMVSFGEADGLPNDWVNWIALGEETLWVATMGGGGSLWEGRFKALDELHGCQVLSVYEDSSGRVWWGQMDRLSCLEGDQWCHYTKADGLAADKIDQIVEDATGTLWFKSGYGYRGVTRYASGRFEAFNPSGPQWGPWTSYMYADRSGRLWFGSTEGLTCYDGEKRRRFDASDGLPDNNVLAMVEAEDGDLLVSTGGGIARYVGGRFRRLVVEDPFFDAPRSMLVVGSDLWLGSRYGLSRYDGQVRQRLDRRSGLSHDLIQHLLEDGQGNVWVATQGGLTRYRPRSRPPVLTLVDVVCGQRHGPVERIEVLGDDVLLAFEFVGRSLTTHASGMAYRYRLDPYEEDWQVGRKGYAEYADLPQGGYTFRAQAVDIDFNYSAEITVEVAVEPDPQLEGFKAALGAQAERFVGHSPALRQVEAQLAAVAATDVTVLVRGETGTGKGMAARLLHNLSPRQGQPFIQVNCGALPAGLVESELFGHEKGAFTGAVARQLGKVELAGEGTLFLDEIGDLALESQVKLLRFLEDKAFERVGGNQTLTSKVRLVAATNRDLEAMVEEGTFRRDLLYRLQVYPLELPPVRQRREDIPFLALYFAERMAGHLNKRIEGLEPEALEQLDQYDWPGNVRELEHVIQRAVILCPGTRLRTEDLGLAVEAAPQKIMTPEEYERWYLRQALEACAWVVKGPAGAAARLGMPPSSLNNRIKRLGLRRPH